ncbi:MAG: hypothetical protein HUU34_00615 [Saprospiraceae bacterium]|jgi:hypothetical protein|nr:hypothetical protein [Saprospiraceae bacterium]
MEEMDLRSIWKDNEAAAGSYYRQLSDEVMALARRRSRSVLDKVKRIILIEFVAGLAIAVAAAIGAWNYTSQPVFFLLVIAVALVAGCYPYYWLWRRMRHIHEKPVLEALDQQIVVLQSYIRHVVWLVGALLPLGYISGFFIGAVEGGAPWPGVLLSWKMWAIAAPLGIGICWLIVFFTKKYMHATIGRQEVELRRIKLELEHEVQ